MCAHYGGIPIHPRLAVPLAIGELVAEGAIAMTRAIRRKAPGKRPKRGQTLRPGDGTPNWLTLTDAVRPYLKPYGEKAKLARYLGVPQTRVHEFFATGRAAPDAERTLLLLHWLAAKRAGRVPS